MGDQWDVMHGLAESEVNAVRKQREVRVKDPHTGAEKGSKPERYDLIPSWAMDEVARVYGKGAEKYGKRGECNCKSVKPAKASEQNSTVLGCVEDVTRKTSSEETLNIKSAKTTIPKAGENATLREVVNLAENMERKLHQLARRPELTDLRWQNILKLQQSLVDCVEQLKQLDLLTTTMPQVKLEDHCVTGAILEQASSKNEESHGQSAHLSGCPALQLDTNHRNWESGYNFGLSIAALERHISLFKQRQNLDNETGLHHLAHAVFHCLALMTYQHYGLGTDDRSELCQK